MLPIQPPFIPAYFDFRKKISNESNLNIKKSFFLSWEDALWHLLQFHKVKLSSIVLVPEFYCDDVIQNMDAHGLKAEFYKVDKFLKPSEKDFIKKIKKFEPAVVVLFHSVGIKNHIMNNSKNWKKYLSKKTILIEDCVHSVINPKKIKLISENHYLIDSLRKVVPLQGSWLYSKKQIPKVSAKDNFLTFWYRFLVLFWWLMMQIFLVGTYLTKNKKIKKYSDRFAEMFMKIGYDLIGDHQLAGAGIIGMDWFSGKLDINKIFQIKTEQTKLYKKLMKNLNTKYFFKIPFKKSDYKELRGYPLGINLNVSENFLNFVRNNDLLLRFELDDCPWSKKQKIVYLPMGLHVTNKDIEWICNIVKNSK